MYRFVGLATVCACGKRVGDDEKTRRTSRRRLWPRVDEEKKTENYHKRRLLLGCTRGETHAPAATTTWAQVARRVSRRQIYFPVADYERIARINVAYYTRCGNRRVNDTHRIKTLRSVDKYLSFSNSNFALSPSTTAPETSTRVIGGFFELTNRQNVTFRLAHGSLDSPPTTGTLLNQGVFANLLSYVNPVETGNVR